MFRREAAARDPVADRPERDGSGEPAQAGFGVRYMSHPASLSIVAWPPPAAPDPALQGSPRERFAGPAQTGMPPVAMTLPPDLAPPTPTQRTMVIPAEQPPQPPAVSLLPVAEPSVAWPEPGAAPETARARRTRGSDDKLASLWAAEPADQPASPGAAAARPPRAKRLVVALAGVAALMLAGGAAAMLLTRPDTLAAAPSVGSIYNAPMMVLRASLAGQVRDVAVHAGQAVGPDTPLLTVHTARADADFAVLAHMNGVIRSVETEPGAAVAAGAPLVRVLDCDHAFLTLRSGVALRVGQSVQVRLPNLPMVTAKVRASAGLAEPLDALVVPLPAAALGGACPVGDAASVNLAASG